VFPRRLTIDKTRAVSTIHHYRSNLRDVSFNLFEYLKINENVLGHGPFAHLDQETMWSSVKELEKLCVGEMASTFASSDRVPPAQASDGAAILPEPMKRSMQAFWDGGWHLFEVPLHMGGVGAPPTLVWTAFELLAGANSSLAFVLSASFWARIIDRLGTDAQKRRYLPQMVEKHWGAAMVLTEPDAGSDVGSGRAKAVHVAGDEWLITGTKRFITNGDYDFAENIVHLALARPEGAAVGTKGLSMFIVPKVWVNEDGSLGERNGFTCTKLEKKLGIKASLTCEIEYGTEKPCRALLVGDVHQGIKQMFHIIEQARMAVGVKSMATLSTGYLNALAYAKERLQGPDLLRAADKTAPRVAVVMHPDVRRSLLLQKAHAEGMRALILYAAHIQDQIELHGGHGNAAELDAENDLLLPLIKGFCSERGFEQLTQSLQTYGGSGYVQDYPVEQYLRDQKIDSLYEGTTAIQALDLIFRKVGRDSGATLTRFLGRIASVAERAKAVSELARSGDELQRAHGELSATYGALLQKLGESAYHVGLQGIRVLTATAEVFVAWLLLDHALLAQAKKVSPVCSEGDTRYYEGKIAAARIFCHDVLPNVGLVRRLVEHSELEPMQVAVESL
jgi:alkylation response protein AidB-like acyl-CoA dehydrogenase